MTKLITKPGPGWRHLHGPVWAHKSGVRVHVVGLIMLPNDTYRSLSHVQEGVLGRRLVQINGGNKKRGLMAWAINLMAAERQEVKL